MQIADGVFLIASGHLGVSMTNALDCNAYAVRCGTEYVLIDAGAGVEAERIVATLSADAIPADRVRALLLTHYHLDHAGGAAALHRRLGVEVWAGPETAAALEKGDEEAISLGPAKRAGVYPSDISFEACPVARILKPGLEIEVGDTRIIPIATPGHSRDMTCFLLRQPTRTLLFPGDTVFHGGRIVLQETHDCDVPSYARSLRTLASLEFDMLFPGHGLWSLSEGSRHLQAACAHLDRLQLPPNL